MRATRSQASTRADQTFDQPHGRHAGPAQDEVRQPRQCQEVISARVSSDRAEQGACIQDAEQVDQGPVADDVGGIDVERKDRKDTGRHDRGIDAQVPLGEGPRCPDAQQAEDQGRKPQEHRGMRHRHGQPRRYAAS